MAFQHDAATSRWWDANMLPLDDPFGLSDMETPEQTEDGGVNAGFYLPSFFYTSDENSGCSAGVSPDALSQVPDDYFSLPVCESPLALSPFAAADASATPGAEPADGVSRPVAEFEDILQEERPAPSYKDTCRNKQVPSPSLRRGGQGRVSKLRRSPSANSSNSSSDDAATLGDDKIGRGPSSKFQPLPSLSRRSSSSSSTDRADQPQRRGANTTAARNSHNRVEKRYRDHLNAQFERLLAVLLAAQATENSDHSDADGDDGPSRNLSKASVLDLARRTVQNLEKERQSLNQEVTQLRNTLSLQCSAGAAASMRPLTEVVSW